MARKVHLTNKQRELIEKFGVVMDRTSSGLTPIESRIIGLLGVGDTTELTFEEIQNSLAISKGATSNAINRLLDVERVEYITKPGDRRRYFRLTLYNLNDKFTDTFNKFSELAKIWSEILEQRTKETKEFNDKLEKVVLFLEFVESELPGLAEKWKNMKKK